MPVDKFNEEFDVATEPIRKKFSERMGIRPGHMSDAINYFLTAQEVANIEAAAREHVAPTPSAFNPRYRIPNATPSSRPDFSQSRMPTGSWDMGIFKVHTRSMMSELSYQIIVELAGRMSEHRIHCDQWERYTPGERMEIFAHTLRATASTLGRDMMEVALREMFRVG